MMYVCKTLKDMATLLDRIRKSDNIEVVRFKDRMKNPSGGWRDAMINFRMPKTKSPNHICEVQIVHQKMALCRRKDGLGGHGEYAEERNAREILEHLGKSPQADSSPGKVEKLLLNNKKLQENLEASRADAEASRADAKASRADAEKGKVAEPAITWMVHTKLRLSSLTFRLGKWAYLAKKTAPAPVASD